jgi:hypothetical protein
MRLQGLQVDMDLTMYYLDKLDKVLGILVAMTATDNV